MGCRVLHEIAPHELDIGIAFANAQPDDCALFYREDGAGHAQVMATLADDGSIAFPTCGDFYDSVQFTYLFAIDGRPYYLVDDACLGAAYNTAADTVSPLSPIGNTNSDAPVEDALSSPTYSVNPSASKGTAPSSAHAPAFLPVRSLIARNGDPQALAVATGLHLRTWYQDNRCCGRCGGRMAHSTTERALVCIACGHIVYPRISPAVIVAVTDGDRLLLTRYARGNYRRRALVAGFVEIGETPEEAVVREVWEECGVRVKDVRYFASQPWGLSGSLMLGFFASLDGDPEITLQDGELDWAGWVPRDEIDDTDDYALGRALINAFKDSAD